MMNVLTKIHPLLRCSSNRISFLNIHQFTNFSRCINYCLKETFRRITILETKHFHPSTTLNISRTCHTVDNTNNAEENEEDDEIYIKNCSENAYARDFFNNSIHYSETIYIPPKVQVNVPDREAQELLNKNWISATPEELLQGLTRLSYHSLCNSKDFEVHLYSSLLQCLQHKLKQCDDFMLRCILYALVPLHKKISSNKDFIKLCEAIDAQCELRYAKWKIKDCLLISDLFYHLDYCKKSYFIIKFLRKLSYKLNKLSPKDLVRLMFIVNVVRKSKLNMYEVEVHLETCINDLTINELGIVAMGFFKTKSKIRNCAFLKTIINYTIQELDRVDDIPLTALVKLIRYSIQLNIITNFHLLLKSIITQIPKRSLMCLTHIAHASAKSVIYEKDLLDAITMRLNNELKEARIKDIERILFSLSTLNYDTSHPIYNNIIEEITTSLQSHRAKEIQRYPYVLSRILLYLSYMNIYPIHLIEYTMDPEFVQRSCFNCIYKLGVEYNILEHNIKIDVPSYTGPFLREGVRQFLIRAHSSEKSKRGKVDKMITELLMICKNIYNSETLPCLDQLLPHYLTQDVIIGLDPNGNAVPVQPILSTMPCNTIKRVDNLSLNDITWIVLTSVSNHSLIRGSYEPIGSFAAKMRLLRTIGYIPIMISSLKLDCIEEEKHKENYIKNLINSAHSSVMNRKNIVSQ